MKAPTKRAGIYARIATLPQSPQLNPLHVQIMHCRSYCDQKGYQIKAKPEVGIQFGAGGASAAEELASEGTRDVEWAIGQAREFLDAGAYMIMIESEGITENVKTWRTDVAAKLLAR